MPHVASRGGVVADEKFAESNLLGKSYCAICHGDMVIGKLGLPDGSQVYVLYSFHFSLRPGRVST